MHKEKAVEKFWFYQTKEELCIIQMMTNAYESSYNIDQHSVRPHLELSFRTVFALPNASKSGLDWWREQIKKY